MATYCACTCRHFDAVLHSVQAAQGLLCEVQHEGASLEAAKACQRMAGIQHCNVYGRGRGWGRSQRSCSQRACMSTSLAHNCGELTALDTPACPDACQFHDS